MLEILTKQEFDDFARNHELSTFFQSSMWGELKESTGWKSHFVGIKENNIIKGAALILSKNTPLINKNIFYSPRGFLINYSDIDFTKKFFREIIKYVKSNKGIFLKVNPYVSYRKRDINGNIIDGEPSNQLLIDELVSMGFKHNGFTIRYGKDLEPRWLSVLDIKDKSEEEILKNMRGTTRWGINNSYKHGLKLIELKEDRISEYKKLMEHTGSRRGFIDRPLSYYKKMYEVFSKNDDIKILLVELDIEENLRSLYEQLETTSIKLNREKEKENKKENVIKEYQSQINSINNKIEEDKLIEKEYGSKIVVAGGLFMTFGRQVISLFGASYKEFMKFNGQFFLNYEMIKYAINNKYDKFNFFGITGEFNEDSDMYGLFNFKRGFNADVVELIGEFNIVTNKFYNIIYSIMFFIYRKLKRWM